MSYALKMVRVEKIERKETSGQKTKKPFKRELKIYAKTCLAGLLFIYLTNLPLTMQKKYRPAVDSALRGTLTVFSPDVSNEEIEKRVRQTRVGEFSLLDRLFRRGAQGVMSPLPKSIRFKSFTPALVAHEALHYHDDLTPNHYFASTAFGNYVNGLTISAETGKAIEPLKYLGNYLHELKIEKTEKHGNWWKAVLSKGKQKYVMTRYENAISLSKYKGKSEKPKDIVSWIILEGDHDYREYFKRNPTSLDNWRWLREHNNGFREDINADGKRLAEHALHFETLFERPGIGSTIVRLVCDGKNIGQVELEALSGKHRKNEERFIREIKRSHEMFERVGKTE